MSSDQLSSVQAAQAVGVSVPTLLRYAGTKEGHGMVFPLPTRHSRRLFTWDAEAVERWVNLNGKAPPTRRGRPRGSVKKTPENLGYQYSEMAAD